MKSHVIVGNDAFVCINCRIRDDGHVAALYKELNTGRSFTVVLEDGEAIVTTPDGFPNYLHKAVMGAFTEYLTSKQSIRLVGAKVSELNIGEMDSKEFAELSNLFGYNLTNVEKATVFFQSFADAEDTLFVDFAVMLADVNGKIFCVSTERVHKTPNETEVPALMAHVMEPFNLVFKRD